MWNIKTKVIPVIVGATGTISKLFRKYVSNIPGKHEVKENGHIEHCTHTSESANVKIHNILNTESNDISTMNSKNRKAAKLYSLVT